MPFNDKKEWVNPPEREFSKEDLDRGYSECMCGEGINLHQAGFDCSMYTCLMCRSEVGIIDDFLSAAECEKRRAKWVQKDAENTSENFKLT